MVTCVATHIERLLITIVVELEHNVLLIIHLVDISIALDTLADKLVDKTTADLVGELVCCRVDQARV